MLLQNVTPDKFADLRGKLISTHQAEVTGGLMGTITGHGVTANYRYDPDTRTLSVDVIHHPFFIPVSAIEHQLREKVGE